MVVFSAEVVSSGDAGAASRYLPVRVEVDSKELRLRAAGGGAGGGEGEDKGEGEGAQAPAAGELLGAFPREGVVRYCDASRHVVPGPSDCFDVQLEDANGGRRALRLRMPSEDAVSAIVYHMRATDVAGRSLTGSCAPTPKRPGRAPLFELPAEGDWSGRPVAQCADAQTGMTPRRDSARTPRGVPALPKVSAMTQTPTKATEQAGPEATAEVHAEATTPRTERHMQREAALAYIHADYMFAAAAAEATLMALADKQARERASTEAHGLLGANLEASSRWILEGHGRWTKDLHPARAADSGAAPESHPSQSQPRPESAKLVGDRTSMVADVQAQKIALLQQQLEEVKVQQGNMLHARREAQRAHGHKRANEEPPTEQQEHRPGITAAPASTAPARHAHAKAEDKPTGLGGKDDPMRSSAGSRLRFSTGNGFADMMEGLEPSSGDGASALAGTAAVAPHSREKPGRSSWPQRRSLAEKNSSMGVAAVMRSPEVADERDEWQVHEAWVGSDKVIPRQPYRRGRRELFRPKSWEGPHEPFAARDPEERAAEERRSQQFAEARAPTGHRARPASAAPVARGSNRRYSSSPAAAARKGRPLSAHIGNGAHPYSVEEGADVAGQHMPPPAEGDVSSALTKLGAAVGAHGGAEAAVAVLRKFDVDGDGGVSWDQFVQGLRSLGLNLSMAQMKGVYRHFDNDGDGEIEYGEWVSKVCQLPGSEGHSIVDLVSKLKKAVLKAGLGDSIAQAFAAFDEDGDGKLSRGEFIKGVVSLGLGLSFSEARQLADTFDADGSGDIDYHEFAGKLNVPAYSSRSPPASNAPRLNLADDAQARGGSKSDVHTSATAVDPANRASLAALRKKQRVQSAKRSKRTAEAARLLRVLSERTDEIGGTWQLRDVFRRYDVDGSGFVSHASFVKVVTGLRVKLSTRQVRALASTLEGARAGYIQYNDVIDRLVSARLPGEDSRASIAEGGQPEEGDEMHAQHVLDGTTHASVQLGSPRTQAGSAEPTPAASPFQKKALASESSTRNLLTQSMDSEASAPQSVGGSGVAERLTRLRMLLHTRALQQRIERVTHDVNSARRTLGVLDVVGDGKLTSEQFRYGLGLLAPGSDVSELAMIVDAHDLSGERYTDISSLLSALEALSSILTK